MSGFWPFSFKPPLENPRLRPKVLKAPLLYLGPRLGFSRGVINQCHTALSGGKVWKLQNLSLVVFTIGENDDFRKISEFPYLI